jgi:2-polyprenyl-6-hydroxyphenyl methylase/3-demethylubiquinone-9 3-methyltransferase
MLPKGTHDYAKFIKPSALSSWVRDSGLVVSGLRGMNYNPITKHYWLDENVSVNYLMHTTAS